MCKQYWTSFYKDQPDPFPPSLFAEYVMRFVQPHARLCELGCGNGRDSIFLPKKIYSLQPLTMWKVKFNF